MKNVRPPIRTFNGLISTPTGQIAVEPLLGSVSQPRLCTDVDSGTGDNFSAAEKGYFGKNYDLS